MAGKKKAEPVNPAADAAENGIYLDPDLAASRDVESDALAALPPPHPTIGHATIDPLLVKQRESEIARASE